MWQAFIIILLFHWLAFSMFAWLQNNNSTNLPPSPREIVHEIDSLLMREVHLADFFPVFGWLDIFDVDARAKKYAKRMDDILEELLERHANKWEDEKAQKPTDIVDFLLSLESSDGGNDNFPFTRQNMKTLLVDMFGAGTSGPYVVLERSMAELLRNPKVMRKLQDEVRGVAGDNGVVREEYLSRMSFLKAVVKDVFEKKKKKEEKRREERKREKEEERKGKNVHF